MGNKCHDLWLNEPSLYRFVNWEYVNSVQIESRPWVEQSTEGTALFFSCRLQRALVRLY